MSGSFATESEHSGRCSSKKTHLIVSYVHDNNTCNLSIPKGILSETAKMISTQNHKELVAQNDHITVSMNRNKDRDLQISIHSTQNRHSSKSNLQKCIASASFRGPSIHLWYNTSNQYNSTSNNFKRFLSAACMHLLCRRQYFVDTPHVFQHSLTSSCMLAHANTDTFPVDVNVNSKSIFDKPDITFNVGMRYYKSFFHFNAKLISAALKAHKDKKYTLSMARGMILNAAVAACSSLPTYTASKDSSCKDFIFHANTMSWVDKSCDFASKIGTALQQISTDSLRPRFHLSCRTANGVVKFPVYLLPRFVGAWAITISSHGVPIVIEHSCQNIVYSAGFVHNPHTHNNDDCYCQTVRQLRCEYTMMTHEPSNLSNRSWALHASSVIAKSSCTPAQKNVLSYLCMEHTPGLHSLALIGALI